MNLAPTRSMGAASSIEALSLQGGDDFCSGTGELDRVVHDHRPPGATHRLDHGVDIQRHQSAHVDDLGADALLLQRLRRGQ